MWLRNLVFVALLLGAGSTLAAVVFPPPVPTRDISEDRASLPSEDVLHTVRQVDAELRKLWSQNHVQPAPRATELTLVRRLALGLTGRVPSLQEIRQLE